MTVKTYSLDSHRLINKVDVLKSTTAGNVLSKIVKQRSLLPLLEDKTFLGFRNWTCHSPIDCTYFPIKSSASDTYMSTSNYL